MSVIRTIRKSSDAVVSIDDDETKLTLPLERIPGLAYTHKERIARVKKAMAGHRRGEKGTTHEDLEKEVASW